MSGSCQHCGAQLALGAMACFRCGRLVARADDEAASGASAVLDPTNLGTLAKAELLESQWRLVKVLGQGSVGQVWLAHDVALDRPVAVKLMHAPLAKDPAQVERFEREGRLLAGMDHPSLLSVLGIGRVDERPFLVTHLLEGKTLAEHLHQKGGSLEAKEVARVFVPICEALSCLHAAQVVHRDLKPSNVFVGDDGLTTLLDLGSALESGSELTRTAPLAFSSPYLSPEQKAGGVPLDGKSDVFALGCLLREVLPPAGAPVELVELARLAMSPTPGDRPTADEFRNILARFSPEPSAAAAAQASAPRPPPPTELPSSERVTAPSSPATVVGLAPVLTPLMDEPDTGPARTQLRAGLGPRRFKRSQVKYVVAGGLACALLAFLFAPGPPPVVAPAPSPLEKLAYLPVHAEPEPPKATPDLIEKHDEIARRTEEAARERTATARNPRPKKITQQLLAYPGSKKLGELHIDVEMNGKEVSAMVTVGAEHLGLSPVYLPLVGNREHTILIERRPAAPTQFKIFVPVDKTVRLKVELQPLL